MYVNMQSSKNMISLIFELIILFISQRLLVSQSVNKYTVLCKNTQWEKDALKTEITKIKLSFHWIHREELNFDWFLSKFFFLSDKILSIRIISAFIDPYSRFFSFRTQASGLLILFDSFFRIFFRSNSGPGVCVTHLLKFWADYRLIDPNAGHKTILWPKDVGWFCVQVGL